MSLKLGDLSVCDRQSKLLFRTGESDPQPPPCTELKIIGKNRLHLRAGVPGRKWGNVLVSVVHFNSKAFHLFLGLMCYDKGIILMRVSEML